MLTRLYSVTFVRESQSHKSQPQGHKITTRNTYLQLTHFGRRYTVICIVFDAPSLSNPY